MMYFNIQFQLWFGYC